MQIMPTLLAVEEFPPISKWLKKLPWRAKQNRGYHMKERKKLYKKLVSKSYPAFCLRPSIEKTNSDAPLCPPRYHLPRLIQQIGSYLVTTKAFKLSIFC